MYVLFECPGYGYHYEEHRGIITKVSPQRKEEEVVKREEEIKAISVAYCEDGSIHEDEEDGERGMYGTV